MRLKSFLLFLLVLLITFTGCQIEQVNYDTSPIPFNQVFDGSVQSKNIYISNMYAPPQHRTLFYRFEKDSICKGGFYLLYPEQDLETAEPTAAALKGVFVLDYVPDGDFNVYHTISVSVEIAEDCTFQHLRVSGVDINDYPLEDGKISFSIKTARDSKSTNTGFRLDGTMIYQDKEYPFRISL